MEPSDAPGLGTLSWPSCCWEPRHAALRSSLTRVMAGAGGTAQPIASHGSVASHQQNQRLWMSSTAVKGKGAARALSLALDAATEQSF